MRIGMAGFGKMGFAMASRLRESGADVTVWNREAELPRKEGFAVADTPKALAAAADAVLSSLFNGAAVEAVYGGPEGLLEGGKGKLFIEMSTLAPTTQQEVAAQAVKAGAAFIECAVGGTTGPARKGQLIGLAGGEPDDVARAKPILEKLCRRIEHVGPIGAGATTKLAINLPLLAFWASLGEAMALMQPLGKDPDWLVGLFGDTAGAAAVMKVKAEAIASTLAGQDIDPTFDIDAMRKDLGLMLGQAEQGGFALPVAATILRSFDEAADAGWGRRDCAWIPAFWAEKARRDHG